MPGRFLQVTYRNGEPFAAYLFLERRSDDRSDRTERFGDALVIDYAPVGRAIGIEIVHPQRITAQEINRSTGHWRTCISRRSRLRI